MTHETKRPPLVIIGIDAGDPQFIEEWAGQGHLPNISSVMNRGFWGGTAGPELVTEHGVWISLLSGISRGTHGYHYFRQLKPGTYELESVTGLDIDAPPFWSHLIGTDKKLSSLTQRTRVSTRGSGAFRSPIGPHTITGTPIILKPHPSRPKLSMRSDGNSEASS